MGPEAFRQLRVDNFKQANENFETLAARLEKVEDELVEFKKIKHQETRPTVLDEKKIPDERGFIRFMVSRVPRVWKGELMNHGGEWHFNASTIIGGVRCVDWYQPSQDIEPEPDPQIFVSVITALLNNILIKAKNMI